MALYISSSYSVVLIPSHPLQRGLVPLPASVSRIAGAMIMDDPAAASPRGSTNHLPDVHPSPHVVSSSTPKPFGSPVTFHNFLLLGLSVHHLMYGRNCNGYLTRNHCKTRVRVTTNCKPSTRRRQLGGIFKHGPVLIS